jgi:hypothetical protein
MQSAEYLATQRPTARPWAVRLVNTRECELDAPHVAVARNRLKPSVKAIECRLCLRRYTREDILSGLYQISTKVCSECYARMQAAPHNVSCFGKPDTMQDGKRLLGYSQSARECQELCPDKTLCASVADPASYNPDV